MKTTTNYNLKLPDLSDFISPEPINDNAQVIDKALHELDAGKAGAINNNAALAGAIADADYIALYDTSAAEEKKTLWSTIKSTLKAYFDGLYAALKHTHTKEQISDFPTLGTAAGKDVPTTGNAITEQVVMGSDTRLADARKASDVSDWAKAASKPGYTASEVGAIPASERGVINGIATLTNFKVDPGQASADVVSVSANKTLQLSDAGTLQNVETTNNVTITVPIYSEVPLMPDTEIEILRASTGTVTIVFASGSTVWCKEPKGTVGYTIGDRYTSVCLKHIRVNTWLLQGNVG